MIDYLLKFPDRDAALVFGEVNGFTTIDPETGEPTTTLATHTFALAVLGDFYDESTTPPTFTGYWILFRDLVGIPVPPDADPYIFWSSDSGLPRPSGPDIPSADWA